MKKIFRIVFLTMLVQSLFAQSRLGESPVVPPERRLALVIGISDYEHVRPLKNPVNDADDVTATLEEMGFSVTRITNQTHVQITVAIKKFINSLRANDVVMVYFSGHGLGYDGDNYLLPLDARVDCLEQISIYTLSVKRLTSDIQSKRVRNCFMVLDACRSLGNLYACTEVDLSKKDILTSKGFIVPQNQPRGNIIVYATQAGQTAEDNQKKRNGLFTQEFLKNLRIPGLTFGSILAGTASAVAEESQKMNSYQEPTSYGSMGLDFVFFRKPDLLDKQSAEKMLENGKSLYDKKKYDEAYVVLKQLAIEGDPVAQNYLGVMYQLGNGVTKDYAEAVVWYRKSAEQGYSAGQSNLGFMYRNGYGVTKDYTESAAWYRKSAEQGFANGQKNLGDLYYNGWGVAKDYEEAVIWYRRSVEQNNSDAQNDLGHMYKNGYGVIKDYEEAVKWFRKSAEQGNAVGQRNFGVMYQYGYGVTKDYAEAVHWYRKSAEQANDIGQWYLGYMYQYGYGVTKDYTEAIKWYRKSAEQGNPAGQSNLGFMYRRGYGTAEDHNEAVKWYRKSAEQGDANGQKNLGFMYQYGYGVTKDYGVAVLWYQKSAEQGNSDAQFNLGIVYEYGYGVTQDINEAKKWYQKSADQGDEDAKKKLESLK